MKLPSRTTQRKQLRAHGLKKQDINLAFRLKDAIEKLDAAIFPEKPARVRIHPVSERKYLAMYTHPHSHGGDYYTIFAKGLHKNRSQEKSNGPVLAVKRDGCVEFLGRSRPFSSLSPTIVALACHEVRHRMQALGRIKYVAQQMRWDEPTELLRMSALYVDHLLAVIKADSRPSRPKQWKRAKEIASRPEVDSLIIETMAVHSFKPGDHICDVVPILLLGTKEIDE